VFGTDTLVASRRSC